MSNKNITQNELIVISKTNYGITLTPRQINYFIDDNLLPKPDKKKAEEDPKSKKTENFFDLKQAELMLGMLKKYKDFGFRSIGSMKYVLGGGNFNLAEEVEFLSNLLKAKKIEEGSRLVSYRCRFTYEGKPIKSLAKHMVEMPSGRQVDNLPIFPNNGIWQMLKDREKYNVDIELKSKNAYFWIKITNTGISIDLDKSENFGIYFSRKID